jgi:type IV secretory pathway TrbF-like protein
MFPKTYLPQGKNETPFNPLDAAMDHYAGPVIKVAKAWRAIAFSLMGLVVILGLLLVSVAERPDQVMHVIEISEWGEGRYRGPVGVSMGEYQRPSEESIRYYLWEWIRLSRSVPIDIEQIDANYTRVFHFVTSVSSPKLEAQYIEINPWERMEIERVDLLRESMLQTGEGNGDVYQVDWIERHRPTEGGYPYQIRYRGIFKLHFNSPEDFQRDHNPLGIYIADYELQPIRQVATGE